jgi:IS30 family transposase
LPEEISKKLKLDDTKDVNMRISHESIYQYLYCLIRQYFPKGTDFKTVPLTAIKETEKGLNYRPRKALGFLYSIGMLL